jgi:hypothetical protein
MINRKFVSLVNQGSTCSKLFVRPWANFKMCDYYKMGTIKCVGKVVKAATQQPEVSFHPIGTCLAVVACLFAGSLGGT